MKTITEIFKTNPSLISEPEVKELIEQFRSQFMSIKKSRNDLQSKVFNLVMNSNLYVIKGLPCERTVELIGKLCYE